MIHKSNDAFGHALWDYYKGNKSIHVIERDDGLMDTVFSDIYFSDYKDWDYIEQKAIKYAKGYVLDIGCGAGRHSLYLQKKNQRVLGIDNSSLTIRIAKSRGLKNSRLLSLENVGKLSHFKFDTFIMLGNNFGLFGNFNKARKLLYSLHKISKPNAVIAAATLDPYKTKSPEHLEYHKLNKKRGRMGGQAKIRVRYKKLFGPWFDYLFVSQIELKKILKGTGWKIKKIIEQKGKPNYCMILKKV